MVLRFTYLVLLLCLVFLMCGGGNAVKNLKDKYSTAHFHKTFDSENNFGGGNEEKSLDNKYSRPYFHKISDSESNSDGGNEEKSLDDKYSRYYFHKTFDSENFDGGNEEKSLDDKYSRHYFHKTFGSENHFGRGNADKSLDDKYSRYYFHKTFGSENHLDGGNAEKSLDDKYYVPYFHKTFGSETKSPQQSSKVMKDHNMEHHGHNHDENAEIGLFTIDELRAFNIGKKLPIFLPIKDHSLYPPFLPKEEAEAIPFSSSQLSNILQLFSVSPDSPKGKAVQDTLKKCELEAAQGETKICATSLESLLGFLRNAFGPEVDFKFISTRHPTIRTPILQNYTVVESPREIKSPKKVACHPMPYLYAIYFCHFDATETKVFKLQLAGDNTGDKVDALVVCHMDTSGWSSDHVAFSMLGIKQGSPVCHVFSQGNIVWIQPSPISVSAM